MSCTHASTTTLLWVYGEGPEGHLEHISGCAACQAVVESEERVSHAIGPVVGALQVPPVRSRPRWAGWVGVMAIAAAALLWVFTGEAERVDVPVATQAVVEVEPPADLDDQLAELDADLSSLEWDLRSL